MDRIKASADPRPKEQVASYVARTWGFGYEWVLSKMGDYPNMMNPDQIAAFVRQIIKDFYA